MIIKKIKLFNSIPLVLFLVILVSLGFFYQKVFATAASVGHWNLDETSGTVVADLSSGSYTGTNTNGATISTDVPSRITFTNPRSLLFTSANSNYVNLPNTGLVGGGSAWTICGWFKTTGTGIYTIYGEGNSSQVNSVVTLDMNATLGNARLFVRDNAGSAMVTVNAGVTINDGAWHLACGVKTSDTNYRLWIDNTQYSPTPSTASLGSVPTLNVRAIGALKRTTVANFMNGNIDDVRVYDRALSTSELTSLYNGNEIDNATSTLASATTSTVVAGTSSLTANGTATTSITVTIKNASSTPLIGETVSLSSSRGGSDTITPASGTTDSNGVATFVVSSSVVGQSTYTATDGGVTVTQTASVTYTGIKTDTGVTYTSTLDNLSLKMDVSYDNSKTNLPIVLDLHGYSGPYSGVDIIQRLANKDVFAIKTYKRGYGGSQGTQDDSGREIYDFYDAVEYVKTHYSSYVDVNNINVIGYSGGGGNTYGLITKFPDYFRSANAFFGMSDYCHNSTYSWWFNGDSSYRTGMQTNIGGTPATVPDKCYSRDHVLGAKNNPYTHIQLFYDTAETTVPTTHGTQYASAATAAGLTNVTTRISDSNSTTTEISDNYSSGISGYSSVANGATQFTWNAGGYINYTGDRTSTFSSLYKKLTSLRNYDKTDRIKASFNYTITSAATNGTVLFGFRNSSDTTLKNAVSIIIVNNAPFVRIDYNGTALDVANRDLTAFTTTLSTGTTYSFDLEMNNSVVTAILKNSSGTTLETKTVNFNGAKTFSGIDSFGIYNYNNGDSSDTITGTFDDLNISAWARWIHGYPQEGAGTAEGNITAENYFVSDMVAGTWSQPVLNATSTMFIPGYIRTKKFQVFLGNGNDEAGNLTYDISGTAASIASPKTLTVEGLTGTSTISLKLYELTPSTQYNIKDSNLTDGGNTVSQATTDSNGTLSFSGTLGSIHQYDIYGGSSDTTAPTVSITAPSNSAIVSGSTVSITADASDDTGVSGVQFKLDTNTNIGSEDTTSSYGVTWDSTAVADGSHTLIAVARDAAGNYATSTAVTVTVDNTAPVRSAGSPSGTLVYGTTGTTLSLTTNETGTCKYATSSGTAYGSMTAFTTTAGTTHSTSITGLSDGNTYTYYVKCSDDQGNINATDYSISFSIGSDTTAPILSSISAGSLSATGAIITWTTDENSTSQVVYGTTASYGSETTFDPTLATSHSVALSGLSAGTMYHYAVVSKDALSNTATSSDQTFTTSTQNSSGGSSSGSRSYSSGGSVILPVIQPQIPGCPLGLNCIANTTPVISYSTFTRNLTLHTVGPDVKTLQQFLILKNFLGIGNDTGYFGPLTYQALVQYQKAMGIVPPSGYFGPLTRSVVAASTNTLPLTQTTTPQVAAIFTKDLHLGITDLQVKKLQQYLNSKGYIVAPIGAGSPGLESLYFGPATQAALIKFQKAFGIVPAAGGPYPKI